MGKKISAKIVILLASILLVAHAVIPHLHYKNEVFIITSDCSADEDHKHNAPEHNDESEKNQHYCLLKQVVLMRIDNERIEITNIAKDINNHFNTSPSCNLTFANNFLLHPGSEINPPVLQKTLIYSRLGDSALNPRGSPTV